MFDMRIDADGRVVVSGRLDASESERALEILDGVKGPTVLDCSQLEYISSAGIAVIMQTYKRLLAAGHSLRLENLTPRVRNVFVYAGLDGLLGIR